MKSRTKPQNPGFILYTRFQPSAVRTISAEKFGLVDKVADFSLFLLDISTTFLYLHNQELFSQKKRSPAMKKQLLIAGGGDWDSAMSGSSPVRSVPAQSVRSRAVPAAP
mgnify:CR=1 FL=1